MNIALCLLGLFTFYVSYDYQLFSINYTEAIKVKASVALVLALVNQKFAVAFMIFKWNRSVLKKAV